MYMQYTISKGRLLVTTAWLRCDYTQRAASSGKGQIKMERRGREERGGKRLKQAESRQVASTSAASSAMTEVIDLHRPHGLCVAKSLRTWKEILTFNYYSKENKTRSRQVSGVCCNMVRRDNDNVAREQVCCIQWSSKLSLVNRNTCHRHSQSPQSHWCDENK